jgi:hypothetical protein
MTCRLALALLSLVTACSTPSQPGPGDISLETRKYDPARDGKPDPDKQPGADNMPGETLDIKPVYAGSVPELPAARRLCDAHYLLPDQRRSACCSGGGPSKQAHQLADECTGILSAAIAGGGVALRDDRLAACVAGLEAAHSTCEWVGPWSPPLPPSCREVVQGGLAEAARCRSNLECAPGLRCAGVGPTDPGVCAPPAPDGARCNTAVDTLATYLRDDDLAAHPGCSGRCVRHRCQPALAEGAACNSNSACAAGLHCDGTTCVAGELAAAGQPCADGGCADGLCMQHVCRAQNPTDSPCATDFECRGACLKDPAGQGRCGPKC